MKPLLIFFLTLQFTTFATAIDTTIGGKRYSCDPIDEPKDVWTCIIDLSIHGGAYYMGSSSNLATAKAEAKSDCFASESVVRNFCVLPVDCSLN